MMTERFSTILIQDKLTDGTWIAYMKGVYDGRDIMSDLLKPSWESSGEYLIQVMQPQAFNNSDASIEISCDKFMGNKIVQAIRYMSKSGLINNYIELEKWLVNLSKLLGNGKVSFGNGHKYIKITEEIQHKCHPEIDLRKKG